MGGVIVFSIFVRIYICTMLSSNKYSLSQWISNINIISMIYMDDSIIYINNLKKKIASREA